MKAWFLKPAAEELESTVVYYNNCREALGDEFRAEVEAAISEICEHPERSAFLASNIQRKRVLRFPYDVLFANRGDDILIVAIMHHHRKPGYWSSRLN